MYDTMDLLDFQIEFGDSYLDIVRRLRRFQGYTYTDHIAALRTVLRLVDLYSRLSQRHQCVSIHEWITSAVTLADWFIAFYGRSRSTVVMDIRQRLVSFNDDLPVRSAECGVCLTSAYCSQYCLCTFDMCLVCRSRVLTCPQCRRVL
jgi:hypothetical protein